MKITIDVSNLKNNSILLNGQISKKEGKNSKVISNSKNSNKDNKTKSRTEELQEQRKGVLEQLKQMQKEEKEKQKYESIMKKVDNGEDLSPQELRYLQQKNPKLYMEIKSEIMMEKQFEQRLKQCKDNEEAKEAYLMETQMAQNICGIRSKSGVKPNYAKFKRLMKRIDKVWEKYQKGELNKPQKSGEKMGTQVQSGSKVEQFDNIISEAKTGSHYNEKA